MSDQDDLKSDEAFEKYGTAAVIVALVCTAIPVVLMLLAGAHLIAIGAVAVLVFGASMGYALYLFGNPEGFVRDVLGSAIGSGSF